MQTLFLRIYGSVILAVSLVLLLSYLVFSSVNQYRYQQHLAEQLSGTLYLLKQGINRQTNTANRERWLELVASLMNVSLTLVDKPPNLNKVSISTNVQANNGYIVEYPINDTHLLTMHLNGVSEQIATGTAFLLLNEIGLYSTQQRQAAFDTISNQFHYPINRVNEASQLLDSEQLERLARGEMVIVWQTEFDSSLSFDIYAPWGNSQDLLKLGTIKVFEQYPHWLLISGFIAVLSVLAVVILFIIRLLVKRLTYIQDKVDAIEPELIQAEEIPQNLDVINQLTWKIDQMALRITRLIEQKHQMLRAVSHDLRTPLSKAQFRLETLNIQLGVDNALIAQTKADLNQLNLLISDLLSYEKLTDNKAIVKENVALNSFVLAIVQGMQIVFPHIEFTFQAQQEYALKINKQLFTRMLENLLNNAARFAKESVTVQLTNHQQNIVLDVIDDGPGVDEQSKQHIFEPFYQQDQSRSNKTSGYGLGLAIVQQIASQHDAYISLIDTQVGAHFSIHFQPNGSE
ncbi:ATP-binding protein [Pseudoalteromonas sp. MMG024]|uniref:sensor histidine kinase n=1 Tax=Pseudoalteromonas sp. MMG024 TaxID=2909980 RepID=UPI001F38B689|nr:ATP-binding protein [Pseudoalteromonas sp. MMG024]MCF6458162.1 ATP-binding protein [Pseudoalteromonas sp. MMG024]